VLSTHFYFSSNEINSLFVCPDSSLFFFVLYHVEDGCPPQGLVALQASLAAAPHASSALSACESAVGDAVQVRLIWHSRSFFSFLLFFSFSDVEQIKLNKENKEIGDSQDLFHVIFIAQLSFSSFFI